VNVDDAETPGPANHPSVVGGNEIVLLVEDNAPLRRVAARQLVELGYQVREAEHAQAAMSILSSADPVNLLFTDVVMPGIMDGLDLAHHAVRLRPGIKILLTSGFSGMHGADQRIAVCPFLLLGKPYGHDELARMLRQVLDCDDRPAPAAATMPSAQTTTNFFDGDPAIFTERV